MSVKRGTDGQQPHLPGLFSPSRSRRLATPREQSLELARVRLNLIALLFAAAWLVIGGRLTYLTLRDEGAEPPVAHAEPGDALSQRADITDRNGIVLATSLPTVSLCANAKSLIDADQAAQRLMGVLPDLNAQKLSEDLHSGKHCVTVKRHLSPKQYYEVNKLGIAGLEFRPDERRIYPAGNLTAHVVGYTDIDGNGIAGIEKTMDERLTDTPQPVALALDLRVQSILRQQLAQAMGDYQAIAAGGLVMDIATGEILGMVSLPDYDPAHPGLATDDQRFNRDTLGVYEMGSVFKIFNTALALDSGAVKLTDSFDTTHPLVIGGHRIRDFEKENRDLNVAEIFTHSSNIGSAHMAQRFGGVRQRAFFERLGLTEKSSIELPEVGSPLLPSANNWGEATTLTAAFGHGVAVNMVQLAGAVGTIVNDGHPVRPTLLQEKAQKEASIDSVVSPRTSSLLRGLMRLVVTRGTAKKAEVEGYMVGGKTGTADKINAAHRYMDNARLSSFIGIFPANAPRYIVYALLDDPKGNARTAGFATGGWVAAPVIHQVIAQMAPILNMAPLPKDMQQTTEREILKPLGNEVVDGVSVEEGSNYASVESDSVQ